AWRRELGAGSWEMRVGSWKLGVGSWLRCLLFDSDSENLFNGRKLRKRQRTTDYRRRCLRQLCSLRFLLYKVFQSIGACRLSVTGKFAAADSRLYKFKSLETRALSGLLNSQI